MKDKSRAISADENDVVKAIKAFRKFLTDSLANRKKLEQIDNTANEQELNFPELKSNVAGRARETYRMHKILANLQEQQEKN